MKGMVLPACTFAGAPPEAPRYGKLG